MDHHDLKETLIKIAPPTGVAITSFAGIPLNEWVYLATIGYIIIQCGCLIWRTYKQHSKGGDK